MDAKLKAQLTEIAQKEAGIETLDWRRADSLDFYELSVGHIKDMLLAAYELGKTASK